jgi:2-phospho-L-lactate guanylyltransferase (CobY/MobA/RfbA family)
MPKVEEIKKDLEKLKEIIILEESEGGKQIIGKAKSDLLSAFDELSQYQTCTHAELMAISCKIVERFNLLKVFTNAKSNAEVLEKILEEEKAPE